MNRFYRIPAGSVVEPAPNAAEIYIKHELLRAWYREDREIDGGMVPVVVLVGSEYSVVRDGSWSSQLDSCVGGCDGGIGPSPGSGGSIRTAYGGMIAADPFGFTEISFPAADEWVILDGTKMNLLGYSPDGTDEYSYDLVNNAMELAWNDPVPLNGSYTSAIVVWSVAATGNDQTYAFTWFVDDQLASKQGEVYLINERGGDIETLVQQGHNKLENGTRIQLAVKNMTGTNLLRLYGLNWRMTSTNQNEIV